MTTTKSSTQQSRGPASGSARWQVGQMARYCSLSCPRALILHDYGDRYSVMYDHGVVSTVRDYDLYTLKGWLAWLDKFRDELTPKDFRAYAESAKEDFTPPSWWDAAVKIAMEPFAPQNSVFNEPTSFKS